MKDLKFKELERIVNEELPKNTVYTVTDIISQVKKKITEVLERYDIKYEDMRVSEYSGKIYLIDSKGDLRSRDAISITVRRKKFTMRYDYAPSYYTFNKIEIENVNVESIKEYLEMRSKQKENEVKQKEEKFDNFKKMLKDNNIDPKIFMELKKAYNDLEYNNKQLFAQELFEEQYYQYI